MLLVVHGRHSHVENTLTTLLLHRNVVFGRLCVYRGASIWHPTNPTIPSSRSLTMALLRGRVHLKVINSHSNSIPSKVTSSTRKTMVMTAMTMDMRKISIAEEATTRVEEEVMDIHHSKTTTEDPEVEERSHRIVAEGVLHKDHRQEEVDMTSEGWVDLVEVMGHPRGQAEELGLALKTTVAHLIQDRDQCENL